MYLKFNKTVQLTIALGWMVSTYVCAAENSESPNPESIPAASAVIASSTEGPSSEPSTSDSTEKKPVQKKENYFKPKDAPDNSFFAPSTAPASSPATDSQLTNATMDPSKASEISRNEAAAGIFGKHNFTASGIATGEICAFCHAPQGAETKVDAPLWNRSASPLSDYKAFSTLGSSTAASSGSVSIACLSCHDGTQAPNIIINTPGKNGTGSDSINGTKTDSSTYLKGHHPVGMQYGGGGPNHAKPGAPVKLEEFRSTSYSGSGTGTVWWVDTGGSGRQKTDLLLFTRSDASNNLSESRPYVECASCHDPHNFNAKTFLRVPNSTGSGLCLTCHAK